MTSDDYDDLADADHRSRPAPEGLVTRSVPVMDRLAGRERGSRLRAFVRGLAPGGLEPWRSRFPRPTCPDSGVRAVWSPILADRTGLDGDRGMLRWAWQVPPAAEAAVAHAGGGVPRRRVWATGDVAALALGLVTGCMGAPQPPADRVTGSAEVRSAGWPPGARFALAFSTPTEAPAESGYLAFVEPDGETTFLRTGAQDSTRLASNRDTLCASSSTTSYRITRTSMRSEPRRAASTQASPPSWTPRVAARTCSTPERPTCSGDRARIRGTPPYPAPRARQA